MGAFRGINNIADNDLKKVCEWPTPRGIVLDPVIEQPMIVAASPVTVSTRNTASCPTGPSLSQEQGEWGMTLSFLL